MVKTSPGKPVVLESRRDVIFGRDAEIKYLVERSKAYGITARIGRPQMGKSTLLKELAWELHSESVFGVAPACDST